MNDKLHAPSVLSPCNRWRGGLVGPIAGLDEELRCVREAS
jgi:hypothetical protein